MTTDESNYKIFLSSKRCCFDGLHNIVVKKCIDYRLSYAFINKADSKRKLCDFEIISSMKSNNYVQFNIIFGNLSIFKSYL